MESSLDIVITPVTHDLGDFKVHRTLPSRERTMVGPFIFVDEFGPARLPAGQGMDVRPHPHINLATVSYLFDGAIEHRDSIGSHQVIEPGAINLMTAGSGIVHSERSPQALRADGPSLYGMQTWLALPDGREEVSPAFDHVPGDGLPFVEDGAARARVLMGSLWGTTAATRCDSPTIYADIELGAGGLIPVDAEADERAVMLVGGEAALDGEPLERPALGQPLADQHVDLRAAGVRAAHDIVEEVALGRVILGVFDRRSEAVVVEFLDQPRRRRALHVLLVERLDGGEAGRGTRTGTVAHRVERLAARQGAVTDS